MSVINHKTYVNTTMEKNSKAVKYDLNTKGIDGGRRRTLLSTIADMREKNRPFSGSDSGKVEAKLDQVMQAVDISRMKTTFKEADVDNSSSLTLDEFKRTMMRRKSLDELTDEEMELTFMMMDADCNDVVDWGEYMTFQLLQYKERNEMLETSVEKPFSSDIKEISTNCSETIVRVIFYPFLDRFGHGFDYAKGMYGTLSKDGVIQFWNMQMKPWNSFHTVISSNHNPQTWFVDMVCFPGQHIVAVASTDRQITFFDMSKMSLYRRYVIAGLDDCITCMAHRTNPEDAITYLIWGDARGNIFSMQLEIKRGVMFGSERDQGKKASVKRISFAEIQSGLIRSCKLQKLTNVHVDSVSMIKSVPELNCFISCCQSSNLSFHMGYFNKKAPLCVFNVRRGITCFDYSHHLNVIATGGIDHAVRIWNPYVPSKPTAVFRAHTEPVVQTILNGKRSWVISIDSEKSIRVHDLKENACLQLICGRVVHLGPMWISAVFFNPVFQHLVLATNLLALVEHPRCEVKFTDHVSHHTPLVQALYNDLFKVVVSASEGSIVRVWNINTGKRIMQFIKAHSYFEHGVEIPVEITAMTFHCSDRMCITGARDGTVKVWNFNNGLCLQSFQVPEKTPVTAIVCVKTQIFVTGWSKNVSIYLINGSEENRITWPTRHKEDILSIAPLGPNFIVTSSYDGDVIIWSIISGTVYRRLNAYEGTMPLSDCIHARKAAPSRPRSRPDSPDCLKRGCRPLSSISCHDIPRSAQNECKHPLLGGFDIDGRQRRLFSRSEYEGVCRTYEAAVEKVLFLSARENMDMNTAVIITGGAEGWVRAWSIHPEGGLLGQFNAAHNQLDSITTLATDNCHDYLITADSSGYVKTWDLTDYCTARTHSPEEQERHLERLENRFSYFRFERSFGKNKYERDREVQMFITHPAPMKSKSDKTMKVPLLLNSFRAHAMSITSLDFINERKLLVTGSMDCSVRLWTICGRYIGTFGEGWTQLDKKVLPERIVKTFPDELKRSGSALTLRVLNGGKTPRWEKAMKVLRQAKVDEMRIRLKQLEKEGDAKTKIPEDDLVASNILGKAYKLKGKNTMPLVLPKFIETERTIGVYHSLSLCDINPILLKYSPKVIEDIHQRRRTSVLGEFVRHEEKGVVYLYNKIYAEQNKCLHKACSKQSCSRCCTEKRPLNTKPNQKGKLPAIALE